MRLVREDIKIKLNIIQFNNLLLYLDGPVITAGTDELGPSTGWVTGVNEGGVALQALDSLSSFTVPHSYSLVCAR